MKRTKRNHGAEFKAQVAFAARTADSAGSAPLRRSLTYDQGPEMREHHLITKQPKVRVYCGDHPGID
jgi:IS30 family transposase